MPVTGSELEYTHDCIPQRRTPRLPIKKEVRYLEAKEVVELWIEQRSNSPKKTPAAKGIASKMRSRPLNREEMSITLTIPFCRCEEM